MLLAGGEGKILKPYVVEDIPVSTTSSTLVESDSNELELEESTLGGSLSLYIVLLAIIVVILSFFKKKK